MKIKIIKKYIYPIITVLFFVIIFVFQISNVFATSGCCSYHDGVCGCGENGRQICCDGSISPSCGCDSAPTLAPAETEEPNDAYIDYIEEKYDRAINDMGSNEQFEETTIVTSSPALNEQPINQAKPYLDWWWLLIPIAIIGIIWYDNRK